MASALMIPAFSPRSWSTSRPQVLGVVESDRRDDGDPRVRHVGGVPGAAHADLDDRDVDRRVGEQRVGHADHDLEEHIGYSPPASTICTYGAMSS